LEVNFDLRSQISQVIILFSWLSFLNENFLFGLGGKMMLHYATQFLIPTWKEKKTLGGNDFLDPKFEFEWVHCPYFALSFFFFLFFCLRDTTNKITCIRLVLNGEKPKKVSLLFYSNYYSNFLSHYCMKMKVKIFWDNLIKAFKNYLKVIIRYFP
jgi:hypothetical protein